MIQRGRRLLYVDRLNGLASVTKESTDGIGREPQTKGGYRLTRTLRKLIEQVVFPQK